MEKLNSPSRMLRVDLHSHSWYSGDSPTSPRRLVERARAAGLDRIAVTDHNAIAGAQEAHTIDPELVIVGEEVSCACGTHLIGLFIQELIPKGVTVEDAARRIREQDGVVYAPHPFAYLSRPSWRAERVLAVADVVEAFNSRANISAWNRKADRTAQARGLPRAAGSDAHWPWEIGRVYTELPFFNDAESFRRAVANAGTIQGKTCTMFMHFGTIAFHSLRTIMGRGHGRPLFSSNGRNKKHGAQL
jgi:predicted metal-dependent phosphoesterase TrpH